MREAPAERLVDNPADIQVLAPIMEGAFGAAAVGLSYSRMPEHKFPDIDKRAQAVSESLSELQKNHPGMSVQLHEEYLNSQRVLANLSSRSQRLPQNLSHWTQPDVTLTELETAAHGRWKGGYSALDTIDLNAGLKHLDATELANKFTSERERPPFAHEIKLAPGMEAVSHPVSHYNRLVSEYNEHLSGLTKDEQAFHAADMSRVKMAAGVFAGSLAIDTALDYTLLRDRRVGPLTCVTDLGTPFLAGFLHRYIGPAAFALPTVAHIAEKLLIEPAVDPAKPQAG